MKIGLLPLYVKLYDDKLPELRVRMNAFYEDLAKQFEKRNIEVVRSEFCRLADEFQKTVKHFEAELVELVDGKIVKLIVDKKEIELDRKDIAIIRLAVKF